jgi:hypothetical protein
VRALLFPTAKLVEKVQDATCGLGHVMYDAIRLEVDEAATPPRE